MFYIRDIPVGGDGPVVALSPMAGISDSPYRKITRRLGSAVSFTEFVSTEGLRRGNRKTIDMFRYTESERPLIFQIFGRNPESIIEAALIAEEMGPDIIDLNMGCSVKKVALKGAGAGLLRDPILVSRIVSGMVKALRVPVTAKIRLGWSGKEKNYREIVKSLEESGISMISVHGRTRDQGYKGYSDWNTIGDIKSRASVPILGNGDVLSHSDAKERIARYGVDGVLIGRAAIGNPWIFSGRDRSAVSVHEVVELVLEHLNDMLTFYGEKHGLKLFRKHVVKYMRGFSGAGDVRNRLVTTDSVEEFRDICNSLLLQNSNVDLQ